MYVCRRLKVSIEHTKKKEGFKHVEIGHKRAIYGSSEGLKNH